MDENKNDKRKNIIILILVLIIALGGFFLFNRKDDDKPLDVDTEQSSYVKPEKPVDRSKNVTLPCWGAFNIPANTKEITQGFEFHNPEENFWYVDKMSVDGKEVEDLVVDSGNKVELNHYLKLNGIDSEVKSVGKYDKDLFEITKTKKGKYQIEAIGYSDKAQTIKIKTKDGKSHKIGIESKSDCFCDVFLTPFFEQIYVPRNCACRKEKGTDYAANCLKADLKYYYRENGDSNSGYVLKADIHHYFQSIDHDILKRMLHPILPDGEVKDFLFYIIDSFDKGGLPLGNQTSQLLALYYLHPVDVLIQNKYGVMFDYGALFSRYMDDLALIAEDKQTLIDAYKDIDFILRNALNLCFNDKTSIHPLKNGIGFLGWNYYLLKTGRVLKKRKKDAKDRAKKKVKLAIYLYEENIIDARSYGNRITSVLATLKKGNAGAFQRTLIHMQTAMFNGYRKENYEYQICEGN